MKLVTRMIIICFKKKLESFLRKGMVLKRLDVLDLVLEKAQLESGQHE